MCYGIANWICITYIATKYDAHLLVDAGMNIWDYNFSEIELPWSEILFLHVSITSAHLLGLKERSALEIHPITEFAKFSSPEKIKSYEGTNK